MSKKSVQGIVVKVKEDIVVLLSEDGTFKNVPRNKDEAPPLIGERYTHIEKKVSWLKYTSVASVFLLALITYLFLPFSEDQSTYVVAIDINPSVELTVNDELTVIEASGANEDGTEILAAIEMKQQPLAVAIEKLMEYSEEKGYFLEDNFLTASVIAVKKEKEEVIAEIEQLIESKTSKSELDVVILRGNRNHYDEAKRNNLTVNQYTVYQQLEDEGVVNSLEEVKGKSMAELRKMHKVVPGRGNEQKGNSPNNSNRPDEVGPPHENQGSQGNGNGRDRESDHPSNNSNSRDKESDHPSSNSNSRDKESDHPSNNSNSRDKESDHPSNNSNSRDKGNDHPRNNGNSGSEQRERGNEKRNN